MFCGGAWGRVGKHTRASLAWSSVSSYGPRTVPTADIDTCDRRVPLWVNTIPEVRMHEVRRKWGHARLVKIKAIPLPYCCPPPVRRFLGQAAPLHVLGDVASREGEVVRP